MKLEPANAVVEFMTEYDQMNKQQTKQYFHQHNDHCSALVKDINQTNKI